jgi:hypothetical protein
MRDEMQRVFDIVTHALAVREAELSAAKALCARAADALALLNRPANSPAISGLIVELRKAADEASSRKP